jgi:DoxX-like family
MKQMTRRSRVALWSIQGLLAALFLFAGGLKLVMPIEMMKGPVELPGLFLRFLGVCEVLGAIGLILPELLRITRVLTPLAAAGLTIIMVGATVITAMGGSLAPAVVPFVVGVLLSVVAYVRGKAALAPAASPAALLKAVA